MHRSHRLIITGPLNQQKKKCKMQNNSNFSELVGKSMHKKIKYFDNFQFLPAMSRSRNDNIVNPCVSLSTHY